MPAEPFCPFLGDGSRLGVQQVGAGDVCQSAGGRVLPRVEPAWFLPIQVPGAHGHLLILQGEGEDRCQASRLGRQGEVREAGVLGQGGHRDGPLRPVSDQAGSFTQMGLQPLVPQGRVFGGGDVVRLTLRRDPRDPDSGDRKQVHDLVHELVEDRLDREVCDQGVREVAQDSPKGLASVHSHHVPDPPHVARGATGDRGGCAACRRGRR